jgi:hypothetical protein
LKKTVPSLFIIESLGFDDEKDGASEGRVLKDILTISGRPTDYIYIRTRKELRPAIEQFLQSNKRYLHISCHGNRQSIALTLDTLSFEDFGAQLRTALEGRRLFMSACEVVNDELAAAVLPESGCFSLIGPSKDIRFDDAVLMWASFYHLMFRDGDRERMKGGKIRWSLRHLRDLYNVPFSYYRPDPENGYAKVDIDVR